jgi:hypothetical protein
VSLSFDVQNLESKQFTQLNTKLVFNIDFDLFRSVSTEIERQLRDPQEELQRIASGMRRVTRGVVTAVLVTALARGVLPSARKPMRALWPLLPPAPYVDQQGIDCKTKELGSADRVPRTLEGAPARGFPARDVHCLRAVSVHRATKAMGGLLRIRGGREMDASGDGEAGEGGQKGAAEKNGTMDPKVLEANFEEERAEALEAMGDDDASRDAARVNILEEMVVEFHQESGQTKAGEVRAPAVPHVQHLGGSGRNG